MTPTLVSVFEGQKLPSYVYRGRPCWIAAEAGRVAGYTDGARFVDKIRGPWRSDFVEGQDMDLLRGADLEAFREVPPKSGESSSPVSPFAGRLLILYESGLLMGLLLAKTDRGRRLRRFIVDEVLPQLLRTGRVVLPGAPADPEVATLRAENEALRARVESLTLDGIAGVIGADRAAKDIIAPLEEIAALHPKGPASGRRCYANKLRNAIEFNGSGSAWSKLPRRKLADAELELGKLRTEALKAAKQRGQKPCDAPSTRPVVVQLAFSFALDLTVRRAS